ncbi:MAG TPA: hypothetical protein VLA88_03425 [Candidatus Saccharimonadales bacterium]|nr:hypothetical protein [Candidatus Saccharimonadales bacterium]
MGKVMHQRLVSGLAYTLSLLALFLGVAPVGHANAASLSPRKVTLGSSAPSAVTTHKFEVTVPTTADVGSVRFWYCTTGSGTCTTPTGLSTTSATLDAQTGATGFTLNNSTNGLPYITRTAASISSGTAVSYTLGNVTNPSTTNTTFYIRMATFASTDISGTAIDTGNVLASTATPIGYIAKRYLS